MGFWLSGGHIGLPPFFKGSTHRTLQDFWEVKPDIKPSHSWNFQLCIILFPLWPKIHLKVLYYRGSVKECYDFLRLSLLNNNIGKRELWVVGDFNVNSRSRNCIKFGSFCKQANSNNVWPSLLTISTFSPFLKNSLKIVVSPKLIHLCKGVNPSSLKIS